ncbi:MAG: hypothetical protein EXS16_11320 [Gemmataceae bacterium]|nr:hypothetical protein [Gemmataceae bacterium]
MRTFKITPMVGVGPVCFGIAREQVRKALRADFDTFRKSQKSRHETDAFDTLGMHIYYTGDEPVVGFVELWDEEDSSFLFDGHDVFRTEASKLVGILSARSDYNNDQGSIVFPKLQVALYRSHPFDPDVEEFDAWEAFSVGPTGYFKPRIKNRSKS